MRAATLFLSSVLAAPSTAARSQEIDWHVCCGAIGFQPTGGADEVNPVIRTPRSNGIEMTALHRHMLDEQPRPQLARMTALLIGASLETSDHRTP